LTIRFLFVESHQAGFAVFPAIGVAENQTGFSTCLLKAKNTYHPTRRHVKQQVF
jgi:hypothetical protein